MKYFNFNNGNFPYFALIAANSAYEAIGIYVSQISIIDEDCCGEMPDEISVEDAKVAFEEASSDDPSGPNDFVEYEKEFGENPHIVLADDSLC